MSTPKAEKDIVDSVICRGESRHFDWYHNVFASIQSRPDVSFSDHTYGVYSDTISIFASLMEKEE